MNPKQIERFFELLARELHQPATVILTGAAAAALWGQVRPSLDVDFAITRAGSSAARWRELEAAIARVERLTGIRANYAEDIDRWGSITLLDYRRHTMLYRKFGTLSVRLLDPAYWSIGKMARYLDPDVQDLTAVLHHQRVPAGRLIRLWARALRASPRSSASTQFRHHAEHFLRSYGRFLWGDRFDVDQVIHDFRNASQP